jgi:hypothetical protein
MPVVRQLVDALQEQEDTIVELQAARIADPVERLRYLRRKRIESPERRRRLLRRLRPRAWQAIAPLAVAALLLIPGPSASGTKPMLDRPLPLPAATGTAWNAVAGDVWLVDRNGPLETYSNGLRIENQFVAANRPRGQFPVFRGSLDRPEIDFATEPRGIVFHTTESLIPPLEQQRTPEILRRGRGLLEFVRQEKAYHFVIDRFARVHRVVPESDVAFHAGASVWGDPRGVYINLNDSFLGVAVEAATAAVQGVSGAQVQALKSLTQFLRAKYRIPAGNCVTHAQVSVNPDPGYYKIAYHTDWAGDFPFREVDLPDNYALPPASVWAFGFDHDQIFLKVLGGRPWQGLTVAQEQLKQQAAALGISHHRYKALLEQRYRRLTAAYASSAATGEKNHAY